MQPLADAEMDAITASGFSSVTVENDIAKVWLNIHVETHAHIDSFKANYSNGEWDQEWYDVFLGAYDDPDTPDTDNPLKLQGFILEAAFDDIEKSDMRLLSLKMGFDNVEGQISAVGPDGFVSFTGFSENPREAFYRENRGAGTFTFGGGPDDYIHVIFDARGYDTTDPSYRPGIYMDFGGAEFISSP